METLQHGTQNTKPNTVLIEAKKIAQSNIKMFKDKMVEINTVPTNINNLTGYVPDWLLNNK